MSGTVLTFEQALSMVLEHARDAAAQPSQRVEDVLLESAAGRVLAEAVMADRDQPPFDRSTRDGFAIRAADAERTLRVVGLVRAGEAWSGAAVSEGEAVEIMTGAALPEGADAVVMIEHVAVEGDSMRLNDDRAGAVQAGMNIVPRGAEAREGAGVLRAGTVLRAAEIAVAASCGRVTLPVTAGAAVAIVSTGDELVEVEEMPGPLQIRNSNNYALAALVRGEGGEARTLPLARDTMEDVREKIMAGREAELLVLSGGVSMGKYDLVEAVLAELGAEFFFTGVWMQPGKPVVFGRVPRADGEWTYFFGLPGNPVSTQVTFALFVAPLLRGLMGRREVGPRFMEARLSDDVKGGAKVTRFLPAEVTSAWDGVTVSVVGWHGSGDVAANARGNGYVVLPAGGEGLNAGNAVRVLLR